FLVAALVLLRLPESVRFLMTRATPDRFVAPIVARMYPDVDTRGVRFTAREERLEGISIKHLFIEGRALPTLLLWVPSFLGFGALAVAVLWIPTLMNLAGLAPATTS